MSGQSWEDFIVERIFKPLGMNESAPSVSTIKPNKEDAYVTFSLKADGSIEHARLQTISPMADFSFDYQDLLLKPVAR